MRKALLAPIQAILPIWRGRKIRALGQAVRSQSDTRVAKRTDARCVHPQT
jgi:hypothetical protein